MLVIYIYIHCRKGMRVRVTTEFVANSFTMKKYYRKHKKVSIKILDKSCITRSEFWK